jgi:hypothetical protein
MLKCPFYANPKAKLVVFFVTFRYIHKYWEINPNVNGFHLIQNTSCNFIIAKDGFIVEV